LEQLLCVAETENAKATKDKDKGKGKGKSKKAGAAVSCPCPVYGCDEVWTRADSHPDPEFQLLVSAALPGFSGEADDDAAKAKRRKMHVIDLVDEDS
jgi:hypothetical protein